ncbi:MAG: hypothetical protein IPL43_12545 [Micropruina sp.]|nr:hypothetical protein [Micropruina sp.]
MPTSRRAPRRRPLLTTLLALSLAACTPGPVTDPPTQSQPREQTMSPSPTASREVPITITVGDRTYSATLANNPTAHDLAAQLPLTLTFRDFNRVEKIAPLPRPLSMQGVPAGADPEINDIGYYRPSNDLVLYYGDVGYWNGIVRLGTLPKGMDAIADYPDGFTATIARA